MTKVTVIPKEWVQEYKRQLFNKLSSRLGYDDAVEIYDSLDEAFPDRDILEVVTIEADLDNTEKVPRYTFSKEEIEQEIEYHNRQLKRLQGELE